MEVIGMNFFETQCRNNDLFAPRWF